MTKEAIPDSVMNIPGYNIFRKDRVERTHNGVCVYVQNQMKVDIVPNLTKKIATRGVINYSCCDIPPSRSIAMIDYLADSLNKAEAMYSDCGIVLMGDLNSLRTSSISRFFNLKQLVKGENT